VGYPAGQRRAEVVVAHQCPASQARQPSAVASTADEEPHRLPETEATVTEAGPVWTRHWVGQPAAVGDGRASARSVPHPRPPSGRSYILAAYAAADVACLGCQP
jgi:hypothetical protein